MVVCGSAGRATDVAETVDGAAGFFFPNQFMFVCLFLLLKNKTACDRSY